MLNYIVLKTLFLKNEENQSTNYQNEIMSSCSSLEESHIFIRNLEDLNINGEYIYIPCTGSKIPTIKDIDGLFLVNEDGTNSYDIYLKKTIQIEGYIYNSVDIQINKIGTIEILEYQNNFLLENNQNKNIDQNKNQQSKKKKTNKNNNKKKNLNMNKNRANFNKQNNKKNNLVLENNITTNNYGSKNNDKLNFELIKELKDKLKKLQEKKTQ